MDDKTLGEIARWMRSTDLVEASYRRAGSGAAFQLEGAEPCAGRFQGRSLVPVASPEVGIFRANALGSAAKAGAGSTVKEGETLGFVEVGSRKETIPAPVSGRIAAAPVEDGQTVQYGQALFFIEP